MNNEQKIENLQHRMRELESLHRDTNKRINDQMEWLARNRTRIDNQEDRLKQVEAYQREDAGDKASAMGRVRAVESAAKKYAELEETYGHESLEDAVALMSIIKARWSIGS